MLGIKSGIRHLRFCWVRKSLDIVAALCGVCAEARAVGEKSEEGGPLRGRHLSSDLGHVRVSHLGGERLKQLAQML